ncbi:MAG TPA: transporter, partial [bacterium]|nr:transporter [bacterium]
NVAAGDVDGDGQDEIITGVSSGGGPQVKIFSGLGALKSQFFAYDKNFRGGVNVAVADVDGGARNKKAEIITAPGQGGGPHIIIFNNYAQKVGQFFAYDKNFRGGVNVYGGDVDNDGLEEIITGAGPGGAPHVRIFKKDGTLIHSFYSLNKDFSGGVKVGVIKY